MRRLLSRLDPGSGNRGPGPIGLELGADRVRLVQLERRDGAVQVRARCSAPIAQSGDSAATDTLRPLVRKALGEEAFRGRRVVTAMPDADVKLMLVNYEARAERSEPELILGFVAERTGEAIEECVVDYRAIRTNDEEQGSRSALVAVARREAVIDYLERLREAGLRVEALEIAPTAIHRLVAWLGREAPVQNELVLHGGRRRSHLVALSGRQLVLHREIELGVDSAIEALAKSLDVSIDSAEEMLHRYGVWPDDRGTESWEDPAEAVEIAETLREILKPSTQLLTEEVKRAGVYTASRWRGASLDRVSLLGCFGAWPRVDRLLEATTSIPTQVLDPLSSLPTRGQALHRSGVEADGEMAIAAGLALRGMTDDG